MTPSRCLPLFALAGLLGTMPAAAADAGQAQKELRELRERIGALKNKLDAAEETRSEATDALRESEQAISDANRELRELARKSREAGARLGALRKSSAETGAVLRRQQDLLALMLRHQYMQGEPETLKLILSRVDPNDMARQLRYLGYVGRSRAQLVDGLRDNLRELDRLKEAMAAEVLSLSRIAAEQSAQKTKLEAEKHARAGVLAKISRDILAGQKQIQALRNNENRLTRLVEQLARLVRTPSSGKPRMRNEAVPADSGSQAFATLRGLLALPVRGELGSRFGSPRSDGGLTWKGLFIAARQGADVRAVAGGRVVYADWLRGFGNLLIIDHGDNYMTLYANVEALLRQVGDRIRGGETVATVGNSGGNDQSGLYFEMRHQGRAIDPLTWINR